MATPGEFESIVGSVGLLGGTFDPPHIGHLIAALAGSFPADSARMVLVPAGDPWQKTAERAITPAHHRLAMVRAAIQGLEGLSVDPVEVERDGPSFMVDTLLELSAPDLRLALVLGSDAARHLNTWNRYDELPELADLIIVSRPGTMPLAPDWWPARVVEIPLIGVSSSDLRRRFTQGEPVDAQTPPAVVAYAREHRLYADRL